MTESRKEADEGHYLVIADKFDEAIPVLSSAIENWGSDTTGLYMCFWDRGVAYDNLGRHREAISDFTDAISLESSVYLYHARGTSYRLVGDFHSAFLDFEAAYKILPSEFYTAKYYSELLSCSPIDLDRNGARALAIANDIHNGTPETLDLIACAHAENGDFETAVKLQEQIQSFWNDEHQDADAKLGAELASDRLRLFRDNIPIRLRR